VSTKRAEIVWNPSRFAPLILALALAGAAPRPGLNSRIEALQDHWPALKRAHIGYRFVDLATGRVLADRNSSQWFTPASNRKLFTTALALIRLGPGYKFQTTLRTRGEWKPGQPVLHDLELVGGGDPNLSGRVLPYAVNEPQGDTFAPLEDLAAKLAAQGVREIDGDVTGVSTRYPGERYPPDWSIGDPTYGYGAPVSALTIDDGSVLATVTPARAGQPPSISICPAINDLQITNRIVTDPSRQVHIEAARLPGSNQLVLWGTIGAAAPPWKQDFAADDPALFAAEALISVLRARGIAVHGSARAEYVVAGQPAPPAGLGTLLALRDSPPLGEAIQVINKVSENLHAEMLLREVGLLQSGAGTLDAGLEAEKTFLRQIGIYTNPPPVQFADGSGLAREDLATPAAIVSLLEYMWQSPYRALWVGTLPVGGVDGTLQDRFRGIPHAAQVHAKTGTLENVHTLSGYIERPRGRWIAFSLLVNGSGDDEAATAFIDHVCALFLGAARP
jgi:D-alanyl-D-alanine carboxypeptidase/D-alanyl-D-alanine-endopeptidase (penicillin-binding protein 4)